MVWGKKTAVTWRIYRVNNTCDCVRIKPYSVGIWLGFRRELRVLHVEDGDDRWVPHVSEREREVGFVDRLLGARAEGRNGLGPFS